MEGGKEGGGKGTKKRRDGQYNDNKKKLAHEYVLLALSGTKTDKPSHIYMYNFTRAIAPTSAAYPGCPRCYLSEDPTAS